MPKAYFMEQETSQCSKRSVLVLFFILFAPYDVSESKSNPGLKGARGHLKQPFEINDEQRDCTRSQ